MNRIEIKRSRIETHKVMYQYDVTGPWAEVFNLEEPFFAEYSCDISDVPEGILLIPLLCNVLPIAWLFDAQVSVPVLDKTFYESIPEIKKGYESWYPTYHYGGSVTAAEITDCAPRQRSAKSGVFYSGGVDSFDTLFRHIDEAPVLMTIWGADVMFEDVDGWNQVEHHLRQTCAQYGLDGVTIKTAFRRFYKLWLLDIKINPDGVHEKNWWPDFQCGIGVIGHAAPIAYKLGMDQVYIASSLDPDEYEKRIPYASMPEIDESIRFARCAVVHDGIECYRQDKIHNIVTRCEQTKQYCQLRVCWESKGGKNCCSCEKCWRTILGLVAEGVDPGKYGLVYTRRQAKKRRGMVDLSYSAYRSAHEAMRARFSAEEIPEEVRWFYEADLETLPEPSQEKGLKKWLAAIFKKR